MFAYPVIFQLRLLYQHFTPPLVSPVRGAAKPDYNVASERRLDHLEP